MALKKPENLIFLRFLRILENSPLSKHPKMALGLTFSALSDHHRPLHRPPIRAEEEGRKEEIRQEKYFLARICTGVYRKGAFSYVLEGLDGLAGLEV